jgi:ketosteroid isomerase-like protein
MEESRQRELAELARRGIDAFNRGDIATVLEQLDDEIEVYTPPELPNAGIYRGHEGFLRWAAQWSEAWEEFRLELERLDFVGEHYEVVTVRQFGRGAGSGVEVEMRIAQLYEVHDGKATRLHYYPDREKALVAAECLSREADPA